MHKDFSNFVFEPIELRFKETNGMPWFHFSIDDVFESLIEVTDRNIPLFDHPIFAFLLEMHNIFDVHVSLYLFYEKDIDGRKRNLKEVRSLKNELKEHGSWLYFGPHSLNYDTMPFNQSPEETMRVFDDIYFEIIRITGTTDNCASWVRAHFYSELYELGDYFRSKNVSALFTTDRPVGSHRMPTEVANKLLTTGCAIYEGTNFIRTQFRVEFIAQDCLPESGINKLFTESLNTYGYIILYTHEYELLRNEVKSTLRDCLDVLKSISVVSLKQR